MVQNKSKAVMQSRETPKDGLDFFGTPPWATRALCESLGLVTQSLWIPITHTLLQNQTVWEPACGQGHMMRPLLEYFKQGYASDIADYEYGGVFDFLGEDQSFAPIKIDWIITNPPFNRAEEFILQAMKTAKVGVAMFVRSTFLETQGRYHKIFHPLPPTFVLQFSERVILSKGAPRDPKVKYWDSETEKWKLPSTATAYCWAVWMKSVSTWGSDYTRLVWIPPCRETLEKTGDYIKNS